MFLTQTTSSSGIPASTPAIKVAACNAATAGEVVDGGVPSGPYGVPSTAEVAGKDVYAGAEVAGQDVDAPDE
eukprot:12882303-Prorocentrum_lima.AAC.1